MRRPTYASALMLFLCLCLIAGQQAGAQGYDTPLTMQGLNQKVLQSARSRAAGGITLGMNGDVTMMFANPALLQSVDRPAVSLGGAALSTKSYQDQRYGGIQNHSAFNLLVEGVTGWISDPDSISGTPTAGDTVQRPFDAIGPDWNHSRSKTIPMQAFIAVPFAIEDMPVVVGVGMMQWANLNRYYGNNNCFSPSVLSVLNGTISTTPLATTPYITQWYQYIQERDGSINGYGGAVSMKPMENLSVGLSALILSGSTDDFETRVGRGMMTFYNNSLRLSKNGVTSYQKVGTSDYKGFEMTLGAAYSGKNFTFGFSLKPPTTITRTYSTNVTYDSVTAVSLVNHRVDSVHAVTTSSVSGEDKMNLPWRGTVGVSINVSQKLTVGLEYEIRSYASATYTDAAGVESNPWLSASLWHVGAEFRAYDWMSVRGGAREDAEVYEPLSNAIRGEAPRHTVYTLGVGFSFMGAQLNIGYEYGDMKYVDTWSNAVSVNREFRSAYVADISYLIPW
jgi:opacity protein-like surface antigen